MSDYKISSKYPNNTDYGPGIGPGKSSGFGRRSTSNSSQTTTPSNPSPADSSPVKRRSFGPDKVPKNKSADKQTKPKKKMTAARKKK